MLFNRLMHWLLITLGHCLQCGIIFSELSCLFGGRQVICVAYSLIASCCNEPLEKLEDFPDQWHFSLPQIPICKLHCMQASSLLVNCRFASHQHFNESDHDTRFWYHGMVASIEFFTGFPICPVLYARWSIFSALAGSLFAGQSVTMAFIMFSFLGHHPCFIVFDMLVINEKKLANVPLSERIKSMERYSWSSFMYM